VTVRISKAKIPRNESFILRSSVLEDALRAAGIATETSLNHCRGKRFTADFWTPRPNVPHERFYISSGSVPAEQARAVREFVESRVVPEFIAWASGLLSLPPDSTVRRTNQYFVRELDVLSLPSRSPLPVPGQRRSR
jgi:hypothetical protein